MPFKLVAEANGVTNIKVSGGVDKRHGVDPQLVVKIRLDIPGGNLTKLGPLLDLEKLDQDIRIHFYAEEKQPSLDGALADQANGLKPCPECHGVGEVREDVGGSTAVMCPCAICHGTGKVAKDFSITGVPVAQGNADGLPSGEGGGGSDKAFEQLGTDRERLEASAPAKPEKPARRGRKKRVALGNTGELRAGEPGGNGSHASGEGEGEGAASGTEAAA